MFLKNLLVLIDVTWMCQKFLTLVSDLVPLSYCHDLEPEGSHDLALVQKSIFSTETEISQEYLGDM